MTSEKSFQNNFGFAYKTGLKENIFPSVAGLFLLLYFFALVPLNAFLSLQNENVEIAKRYLFFFSNNMYLTKTPLILFLLGIGIFMGIMDFRFITGKKTVNVYYSLGITRKKLFSARYLAGLTLLFGMILLPLLLSLVLNIVYIGFHIKMLTVFFYLTIGLLSVTTLAFSVTALVFSTVGTQFEGILFSGILLFFPQMLLMCLNVLIEKLVFGTPLGAYFGSKVESLAQQFTSLNPIAYLSKGLDLYENANAKGELFLGFAELNDKPITWQTPDYLPVVLWLIVAGVLFAFGMFAFHKRKAEIGGFIGKNKVLNFIGVFIVSYFVFVMLYDALSHKGMVIALTFSFIAMSAVYCILSLVILRNTKEFKKDLVALPIQLGITALIFVFFATGYFGFANRIPQIEKIESAKITVPYLNFNAEHDYSHQYSNQIAGLVCPDEMPIGDFRSEKDIDFVRSIHQTLVKDGKQKPTAFNREFNGIKPVQIKISYTLKNGKEVKRMYYGMTEEIGEALYSYMKTDYFKAELQRFFKDDLPEVKHPTPDENGRETLTEAELQAYRRYVTLKAMRDGGDNVLLVNADMVHFNALPLSKEQRARLLDAMYQDLLDMEAKDYYHPQKTYGFLYFQIPPDDNMETGDTIQTPDFSDRSNWHFTSRSFLLSTATKHTLAVLTDLGYAKALEMQEEILEAHIMPISLLFEKGDVHRYSGLLQYREGFPTEYLAKSDNRYSFGDFTGEQWNAETEKFEAPRAEVSVFKTEKAEDLKLLREKAVLRSTILPEDYIVVLHYENNTSMAALVKAEDMPQHLKDAAANNKWDAYF